MAHPFDQSSGPVLGDQLPEPLPADPFALFRSWWEEAHAKAVQPNPNAMTVATVDPDGRVSARILLCKAINVVDGYFVFYTNYTSRKAGAIEAGSRIALVFHWDVLDRQVRVEESPAARPAESDAYFASRPWQSRIGAWASNQSQPIESSQAMRDRVAQTLRRFGLDPDHPPADGETVRIPRPEHWGGYRVWADRIELWSAGLGRVHDRARWSRTLTPGPEGFQATPWTATRLQP